MKRTLVTISKGVLLSGAIALGVFSTPAEAQVQITIFPPVSFRATARPVFHEGRATYWYSNRWYYRDGGEWHYYRDEPRHLREYRSKRLPKRHHYERGHRRGHR